MQIFPISSLTFLKIFLKKAKGPWERGWIFFTYYHNTHLTLLQWRIQGFLNLKRWHKFWPNFKVWFETSHLTLFSETFTFPIILKAPKETKSQKENRKINGLWERGCRSILSNLCVYTFLVKIILFLVKFWKYFYLGISKKVLSPLLTTKLWIRYSDHNCAYFDFIFVYLYVLM